MSRTKIIFFSGIGIFLLAIGGYFFWQSRARKTEETPLIPAEIEDRSLSLGEFLASPAEKAAKAGYRIIYQEDPDDKTGRGVFYQGRGERTYPEIGWWMETQSRIEDYVYFTGSFVRWEDIPGSKDKYIILKYPEVEEEETPLPPVRIGFEEDHLTSFGVENLDWGPNNQEVYSLAELGWVKDWTSDFEKLIQRDDAVVTTFWRKRPNESAVRDENKNLVAGKLLIRRFEGVEQLEKELGGRKND